MKQGDVVQLTTGGLTMTVVRACKDAVECLWYSSQASEPLRLSFPTDALKLWREPAED
jgi:uncharacterized protein YodC (DUF2158 family)